ncbi:siderophore-interacting protein [Dyella caseinilytica]|uniref:Siderophore-interacting protein n=1 Tax=Dyella caseinilytica TaxID=1849581 RepID=A0ABX7GUV3_9GAMM|nr:siderophore-interacting protein [Dyella caseinilytica]QRN53791.1 siderophore-interacting protein [Dyella caseinilytica]GFZ89237.1 siderophore-interacting protein [Dyella caseinilytica]
MTRHEHQMVRHTLVRRTVEVLSAKRITPHMQRIVFGGEELRGFLSASPDDHVKLVFPNPSGDLVFPTLGPNGPECPPGVIPSPMRDYTPREFDPVRHELIVDFVIHGDGPASTWAERAKPGQRIGIGGPRGSFMIANDFDRYVLVGDETALPAIGRRLDEMHAGARVHVLAEIPEVTDRQPLGSQAQFHVTWLERDGVDGASSDLLERALRELPEWPGDTFYWIAAESRRVRTMRKYLAEERGVPKEWVRASGYWQADGSEDGED